MSIEEIEQELFILDMKDHFTPEDYRKKDELLQKLRELNKDEND